MLVHLNMNKNELQNAVLQVLASDPSTPNEGQMYYNSVSKKIRQYNGTAWIEYSTWAGLGDVSQASNSWAAGRMKVSAWANKVIQDYTSAWGVVKVAADGTVSIAVAETDYVTPAWVLSKVLTGYTAGTSAVISAADSVLEAFRKLQAQITWYAASTKTLTNTTIDANGTGNSISNLETGDFAAWVVQTTISWASTNTQIPTALAVENRIAAVISAQDVEVLKGGIDCSTNPNYPLADAGHVYRVTVAGKIGGASGIDVQVGDRLECFVDSSVAGTHATVWANWIISQANVDRATTTTLWLAEHSTLAETEARSSSTVVVTPDTLVNFGLKKTFTIGDNTATSIACTHSLGTKDVIVQVREVTGDAVVECDIVNTSTTVTTLSFSVAPATNSLRVVIIG